MASSTILTLVVISAIYAQIKGFGLPNDDETARWSKTPAVHSTLQTAD